MRKLIIAFLMIALSMMMVLSACTAKTQSSLEDISTHGDWVQYNYKELKNTANLIAKVQVVDDLTVENSKIIYDPDAPDYITDYYSLREVKITDIYENDIDTSVGDTIEVIEPTAVTADQYLHEEDYTAVEKGRTYIVFLSSDTASGKLSIISCNHGLVDLSDAENSQHYDIAVKTLVEYESNLSKAEKASILNSEIKKPEPSEDKYLKKQTEVNIEGKSKKIDEQYKLSYGKDPKDNSVMLVELDELI